MFGFTFHGGDETARINDIVRSSRRVIDAKDVEYVIRLVDERRAIPGYGAYCEDVRRAYLGDQELRIKAQLARRYKRSHGDMPVVPVGVIRETAEISAQAYRDPPTREILVGGEPLPEDDARRLAFKEMLERAQIDVALQEAERIASTGIYAAFVRMHWSADATAYGVERPIIRAFWPHHVWAVTSTSAPDRVQSSSILVAQIGSMSAPAGRSVRDSLYEVWTRDVADDGASVITYRHITGSGVETHPVTAYDERDLPWACLSTVPSAGVLYPAPARDIMATQDQINIAMSDGWYRHSLQSHKQIFISGIGDKEGRALAYGPDVVMSTAQPGVAAQMLDMQGSIDWHELIERQLLLHGRTEGQPVDAWYTKPGNPETGVSREIRNIYSMQRRREHSQLFAAEESTCILRTLARITDSFGNLGVKIDGDDVTYRTTFAPRSERIEDEVAKTTRVTMLLDRGVIDASEARDMLGLPLAAAVDEERSVDAGATDACAGAAAVDDVQATALSGAQVTALVGIATHVAQGILPRESAIAIARAAFPAVDVALLSSIFSPIEVIEVGAASAASGAVPQVGDNDEAESTDDEDSGGDV